LVNILDAYTLKLNIAQDLLLKREVQMKKMIDRSFIFLSIAAIIFVAMLFYTWNPHKIVRLPDTQGNISSWGVDECIVKKDYAYVSAWSFPDGARKFENHTYIKLADGSGYYEMKGQAYRRNQETSEMKTLGEFDNSGLISAIRILPWNKSMSHNIVIISKGVDGKLYRGGYACK